MSRSPLRCTLTVTDAIVLDQIFGPVKAAEIVKIFDPWCYPGESMKSTKSVKRTIQSAIDKARGGMGKSMAHFTEESKSSFLLSPILTKKLPVPVRKPKAERRGLRDVPG